MERVKWGKTAHFCFIFYVSNAPHKNAKLFGIASFEMHSNFWKIP
jgi:hypothetical protein